jgi:serine/threonine-protein kinase
VSRSPDVSHALPIGEDFDGRYRVVRLIGAGGMAKVYEVLDVNTRRHRALKVMLADIAEDPDLRARFRREATVAAAVESNHVAETLDAGVSDRGRPYIVFALLKGQELAAMLRQRGALPPQEALLYLSQTAMALEKAHAVAVVHRDLKPENLFITYLDDGSPCIKVLDFGIAKVVQGTLTGPATQGIIGTPLYMAPEQIHGEKPISGRTDLFALGHVAYATLAGEPYWTPEKEQTKTPYQLLVRMLKRLPQSPTERAHTRRGVSLPSPFNAWFRRATASEPEDRFEGAIEMIDELRGVFDSNAAG